MKNKNIFIIRKVLPVFFIIFLPWLIVLNPYISNISHLLFIGLLYQAIGGVVLLVGLNSKLKIFTGKGLVIHIMGGINHQAISVAGAKANADFGFPRLSHAGEPKDFLDAYTRLMKELDQVWDTVLALNKKLKGQIQELKNSINKKIAELRAELNRLKNQNHAIHVQSWRVELFGIAAAIYGVVLIFISELLVFIDPVNNYSVVSEATPGTLPVLGFGSVLLASLGGAFLGSFFRTKGKNLADKQDIEELTDKVEGIKASYHTEIEKQIEKRQFRLAALERRLQAHQEAYELWMELRDAEEGAQEIDKVRKKCDRWWRKNNLYLDSKSRAEFRMMGTYLSEWRILLNQSHSVPVDKGISELIRKHHESFYAVPKFLAEGVALPPIGEGESENGG